MAFAAVVGPSERERVIATSSYFLNPATGLAEVAYLVDPDWQGGGLGAILHAILVGYPGEHSGRRPAALLPALLVGYAREHGARGLRADVLRRNSRMMRVFERGDHSLSVKSEG